MGFETGGVPAKGGVYVSGLAIFDIDGTLIDSMGLDDSAYARALADTFGLADVSSDWDSYTQVTDSGIAHEVCERHRGRAPHCDELAVLRGRFLELLEEDVREAGYVVPPIAGVAASTKRLHAEGWAICLASGGWRKSALAKLRWAGLDVSQWPAAFADDALAREEITRVAITRATEAYGCSHFERVVYIGDGTWDVRSCRSIGLPFVGIGSGSQAQELKRLGASYVLADFRDYAKLRTALDHATPPQEDSR